MDETSRRSKRRSLNQEGEIPIALDLEGNESLLTIASKYARNRDGSGHGRPAVSGTRINGQLDGPQAKPSPRRPPGGGSGDEYGIRSTPNLSTVLEHHSPLTDGLSTTLAASDLTENRILVGADDTLNGDLSKYRQRPKPPVSDHKALQSLKGKHEPIVRRHIASYYRHNDQIGEAIISESDGPEAESIGFPQVIKGPVILTSRSSSIDFENKGDNSPERTGRKLARVIKRRHGNGGDSRAMSPSKEQMLPPADKWSVSRILRMMHSSFGKIQGIVEISSSYLVPEGVSFCWINADAGSLLASSDASKQSPKTIIPDLRGCRISIEKGMLNQAPLVVLLNRHSGLELCLRPLDPGAIDEWLAALLCWQPLRPRGVRNKLPLIQHPLTLADKPAPEKRRPSDLRSTKRSDFVMKPTKAMLWDSNPAPTSGGQPGYPRASWRPVACLILESGELQVKVDPDQDVLHQLPLTNFQRCAIQQLHPSVLDQDNCIAIYPQYTIGTPNPHKASAIFLSFESKQAFEISFVSYRAFTIPEVYGPPESTETSLRSGPSPLSSLQNQDLFRIEQCLHIKVSHARFAIPGPHISPEGSERGTTASGGTGPNKLRRGMSHENRGPVNKGGSTTAEVWIDGEVRGRTAPKSDTVHPWWREEFEVHDLPSVLTNLSVFVRQTDSALIPLGREKFREPPIDRHEGAGRATQVGMDRGPPRFIMGICDLDLSQPGFGDVEKSYPLRDPRNDAIGEVFLKVKMDEQVVLMSEDYDELRDLLHDFASGLTLQISKRCTTVLVQLTAIMLNIFQSSGKATEWLMTLIDEEVDGLHREGEPSAWRHNKRVDSSDSHDSGSDREGHVRDFGKAAASEAALLFRSNTILTKSFDGYMARLGRDYLEETIGPIMRSICAEDQQIEVDPKRLTPVARERVDRDWRLLIGLTEDVWKEIAKSASQCPVEFRHLFRHVRSCVEDRYGDHLRTVTYSSVSGFIFLRFFVPAILNPRLFDLTPEYPEANAARTCTLLAKNIQGLANMATFGTKEPWMSRMNRFLMSRRQEFKEFIDKICELPETASGSRRPSTVTGPGGKLYRGHSPTPSTSTVVPIAYEKVAALRNRLPAINREGFPSLPRLIDGPKAYASLIKLWLDSGASDRLLASTPATPKGNPSPKNIGSLVTKPSNDLVRFNAICLEIQDKIAHRLEVAGVAQTPDKVLNSEESWEAARENAKRCLHGDEKGSGDSPKNSPVEPPSAPPRTTPTSDARLPRGSVRHALKRSNGGGVIGAGGFHHHHSSSSISGLTFSAAAQRTARAKTLEPNKSSSQLADAPTLRPTSHSAGPSSRLGSSSGPTTSSSTLNASRTSSTTLLAPPGSEDEKKKKKKPSSDNSRSEESEKKEVRYGGTLYNDVADGSSNLGLGSTISRGASKGKSGLVGFLGDVGLLSGKKRGGRGGGLGAETGGRSGDEAAEGVERKGRAGSGASGGSELVLPLNSPPPVMPTRGVGRGVGKGAWTDDTYTVLSRE